jgi:hypothetical protein
MTKARKQKRKARPKAKVALLPPMSSPTPPPWLLPQNYVKRGELVEVRDEIFQYVIARTSGAHDAEQNTEREIKKLQIAVREMRGLLGINVSLPPHARVLGEPVPWSYFHVWIARINERLEQLEAHVMAKYRFVAECPKCGKKSPVVSEGANPPKVNCGDCLMSDVDVVEMKLRPA